MAADEKKEPWLNYLALSTVILAVCATMATFKGGGFSTKSVMSQAQESDQWAFYQAKSIKGYIYEMQRDKLELDLKSLKGKVPAGVIGDYQKKIEEYGTKIQKYDGEKKEIQQKAEEFKTMKTEAQTHGKAFGLAVIFLQIAILLSSIAALMKKKYVWVMGVIVGAVGLVFFANGFFLFF